MRYIGYVEYIKWFITKAYGVYYKNLFKNEELKLTMFTNILYITNTADQYIDYLFGTHTLIQLEQWQVNEIDIVYRQFTTCLTFFIIEIHGWNLLLVWYARYDALRK